MKIVSVAFQFWGNSNDTGFSQLASLKVRDKTFSHIEDLPMNFPCKGVNLMVLSSATSTVNSQLHTDFSSQR